CQLPLLLPIALAYLVELGRRQRQVEFVFAVLPVRDTARGATRVGLQSARPVAWGQIVEAAAERRARAEVFRPSGCVERYFAETRVPQLRQRARLRQRAGGVDEHRRSDRLAGHVDDGAAAVHRRIRNAVDQVELADVDLLDVTLDRRRVGVRRGFRFDGLVRAGVRLRRAAARSLLVAAAQ